MLFRNSDLGARNSHSYWVPLLLGPLSKLIGNICMYNNSPCIHIHLYLFLSLSVYTFKFPAFQLLPLIPTEFIHNPFLIHNFFLWHWQLCLSLSIYLFPPKVFWNWLPMPLSKTFVFTIVQCLLILLSVFSPTMSSQIVLSSVTLS